MKTRKAYPTDLTDKQWEQLNKLLPHKRTAEALMREYIDGILYVIRTGCSWQMLPHDFPPWKSVYTQFRRWKQQGFFNRIENYLREKIRLKLKRHKEPSASIVDSQSVKTAEKGGLRVMTLLKKLKVVNAIF